MTPTRAQRALLRGIDKWGELPPDAEDLVADSGSGMILQSVIKALLKRGWVVEGDYLTTTQAGREAMIRRDHDGRN